MLSRARTWLALLVASASVACSATVVDRTFPGLVERRGPIHKIAVAPFTAPLEHAMDAAPLVSRQLAEALAARGVEIVAPEDVAILAEAPGADVAVLAASVGQQFGADALLVGQVTRWVEREGEALGSQKPAAVGVTVTLHGVPGGEKLWEGTFDRSQQALLENVLLTPRYPGRGTRWLTVAEFSGFAAEEIAARVPVTP